MKKCYYCKKLLWPWQRQYLGSTPAHASCDFLSFSEATEKLSKINGIKWKLEQDKKRKEQAYY